jgi:ABC-2 type transport system ATP-binding protein
VLEVNNLSKRYAKSGPPAIDQLSFKLNAGSFTALLGPNGAGKSTLFQLLTGLYAPDAGEITIGSANLRQSPTLALSQIGIVFQAQSMDLDLSINDNLRFHGQLHGMHRSTIKERIAELLAQFELSEKQNAPVRTLSGGNRRKVELARALLHRPKVLLMDEASVGLDTPSRIDLINYIKAQVTEHQLTVLWATHLVTEVNEADRVLVIHRGRLKADGSPTQLIEQSQTANLESAFLKLTRETT